jgi:hypothetical protein
MSKTLHIMRSVPNYREPLWQQLMTQVKQHPLCVCVCACARVRVVCVRVRVCVCVCVDIFPTKETYQKIL